MSGSVDVVDVLAAAAEHGAPESATLVLGRARGEQGPPRAYDRAALEREADTRAEALASLGAEAGRIHPVTVEPDLAGIVTLLALWRLGAIPAPLNPRLTPAERAAATAALAGAAAPGAQVVLWTSGTAGRPRGVALGWAALEASVEAARARLGLRGPGDLWLASLSPAHVGGLVLVVRSLLLGGTVAALGRVGVGEISSALDAVGIAEGVGPGPDRGGVTHLSLVPTQLHRLLDHRGGGPPPASLRCVLLGGAHTPRTLLDRALGAGWPVALTYGMTEMASQVATAPPTLVARKPGTVGAPLDGVEVRVAPDGELLLRGPTRALGYVGGRSESEVAGMRSLSDADGWYATGDLGHLDEEGHLWITGRRADRIVCGGVTVDAAEVEEALRAHPAVVDAAVAGVRDEEWGERVGALLVGVEGELDLEELGSWLAGRLQAAKRPRIWRLADALPLNANGKVDRARARALLEER